MKGALDGVKILDLSRLLAGPYATMCVADLGATVYKGQPPAKGPDPRAWGPFKNGESCYFMSANRGKKSIAVDMKKPQGREIVLRMAKECDVVIENFRSGVMERLGLGYETLKEENPGIIYCQITGFGQDGPEANRGGVDLAMQAASGLMCLTGYEGMPPVRLGVSLCDLATGMFGTIGILAALHEREKTGVGQKINCSLMESMVSFLSYHAVGYMNTGEIPKKYGSGLPNIEPYRAFAAKDGEFVIGVGNGTNFRKVCNVIGKPELADDPRFSTNPQRVANRDALTEVLSASFARESRDDIVGRIVAAGVPCSEIKNVAEVCADEQMNFRKMFPTLSHPKVPELKLIRTPIEFSNGTNFSQKAPPLLGEDTREVLGEFGYTDSQIDALLAEKVIGETCGAAQ